MRIATIRNYALLDVASALQKAIRRGDAKLAGYWAIELFESGYTGYLWRRLLVVSAEDCWGILTQEVKALELCWKEAHAKKKGKGRIFISKAVILLCQAKKSRDADHLTNLVYDAKGVSDEELEASLDEARKTPEEIPEYAFDCHTQKGKAAGKTKGEFFTQEHEALNPRQQGLFDNFVKKL